VTSSLLYGFIHGLKPIGSGSPQHVYSKESPTSIMLKPLGMQEIHHTQSKAKHENGVKLTTVECWAHFTWNASLTQFCLQNTIAH